MHVFDSYIDAGQQLCKRDREQYYTALIEYLAYGIEPEVKGAACAIMTAIRPSLDESRRQAANGRRGGRPRKPKSAESENPDCGNRETQTVENEKPKSAESENPDCGNRETQTVENEKPKSAESENPDCGNRETQTVENEKANSKGISNGIGKEKPPSGVKRKAAFAAPTPEEVSGYAEEAGISLDAARFCDFYASKGWRVGSSPMKDWRAAARNWARRDSAGGGMVSSAFAESASSEGWGDFL
jgi:hypothetical protein